MTVAPMNDQTRARTAQLFAKTNQFNLTTTRYTEAELINSVRRSDVLVLTMSLCDRYGDAGLVGAVVVCKGTIENFVMSCRVFGRKAESAFLGAVVDACRVCGWESVTGKFIASKRNEMTRRFYLDHGFVGVADAVNEVSGEFVLVREALVKDIPRWISMHRLQ